MEVLSLLGPLTTRSSAAWLSDVINIDVVIKQLSGNEGWGGGKGAGSGVWGRGGPGRDIRPARHVSHMRAQPTKHPQLNPTLFLFGHFAKFLTLILNPPSSSSPAIMIVARGFLKNEASSFSLPCQHNYPPIPPTPPPAGPSNTLINKKTKGRQRDPASNHMTDGGR